MLFLLSWELEIRSQDELPTIPGKITLEQLPNDCKIWYQKSIVQTILVFGQKPTGTLCPSPAFLRQAVTDGKSLNHLETYHRITRASSHHVPAGSSSSSPTPNSAFIRTTGVCRVCSPQRPVPGRLQRPLHRGRDQEAPKAAQCWLGRGRAGQGQVRALWLERWLSELSSEPGTATLQPACPSSTQSPHSSSRQSPKATPETPELLAWKWRGG